MNLHTSSSMPTDPPRQRLCKQIEEAARALFGPGTSIEYRPHSDVVPAVVAVVERPELPDLWVLVRHSNGKTRTVASMVGCKSCGSTGFGSVACAMARAAR